MSEIDITKSFIFFFLASLSLVCAIFSVLAKRIIYSLISAVVVFLGVAGLFFLLGADYNAVVQISVYGVAIPILFVIAIMFTNYRKDKFIYLSSSPRLYVIFFALGLMFMTLTYLIATSLSLSSNAHWILQKQTLEINKYMLFKSLADGLFTNYIVAFEVFSLLLLLIVVGLSMLNLRGDKSDD